MLSFEKPPFSRRESARAAPGLSGLCVTLLTCLALAACSGGGGGGGGGGAAAGEAGSEVGTETAPQDGLDPLLLADVSTSPSGAAACTEMPVMPTKPAAALQRSVTEFGARPNDDIDDVAAIDSAIRQLQPGQWLIFPPGSYTQSRTIVIDKPNVVLWSDGATIHATDPRDQALRIAANGVGIYNFTLTANTNTRRMTPWESRIAIFNSVEGPALSNVVVRKNRIVERDAPGTAGANSASAAGILVFRATRFLVAENTVSRSLADGIHITAGSSDGKVLNNTVRETGDDMIAVVSYLGKDGWTVRDSISTLKAEFAARKAIDLSHNILIENNQVSGQYWGRGITVLGGEKITIRRNTIDRTTQAAGVLIGRESSYVTFGSRDVLVKGNTIRRVQTTAPAYCPTGQSACSAGKTYHGGVEIHSLLFTDEATDPFLRSNLSIENVRLEDNVIEDTMASSIRVGVQTGTLNLLSGWHNGTPIERHSTGGRIAGLTLLNNRLSRAGATPIHIMSPTSSELPLNCGGNTYNQAALQPAACNGGAWTVTGASIASCQ
jgi:parallel beta-helix repeat protein